MNKRHASISAGVAMAAALILSLPAIGQAGGRFHPEQAIADWSGERFTILRIDSLDRSSLERAQLESWIRSSRGEIDALQQSIAGNRALAAALRARSVQLRNVVAIWQALNGNLVVYLR